MNGKPTNFIKKILSLALISLYFCVSLALVVEAQTDPPPIIPTGSTTGSGAKKLYIPHNTDNQTNKTYLENQLLPGIAATIIGIVGGLSLLFVIISGIQFLTSYGNGDAMSKAKNTLTWAIIGIIVASLSYAIVRIISTINPQ